METVGTSWFSKALRSAFSLLGQNAGHELVPEIQPVYDLSPGAIPFYITLHVGGAATTVGTVERPRVYFGTDALVPGAAHTYSSYTIPANTPFRVVFSPNVNGGALGVGDYVQVVGSEFVLRCQLDYARHTYDSGWCIADSEKTLTVGSLCGAGWQGWLSHALYVLPTQS